MKARCATTASGAGSSDASTSTSGELVQEADLGGRKPAGIARRVLAVTCIGWSLLQLWYASPLPFTFNVLILNDTEMRSLHLGFGAVPRVPRLSVREVLAARPDPGAGLGLRGRRGASAARICSCSTASSSTRPGQPTPLDFVTAVAGMLLLLEATRRVVGPPLAIIAMLMLVYAFAGPWMPDVIQHKGVSLSKAVSHYWLSTEGVFGVALGVSASYIFLFVLFGSLLEKAGAGNYFIKVAFAFLGHMRGGPAKAAVVSSGHDGHDLGLVGRQRRHLRHVHDPADEARGIHRREGRRDRDRGGRRWPDHAAGDGRGGVPHGGVRRRAVRGDLQERIRCPRRSPTSRSSTSCTSRRARRASTGLPPARRHLADGPAAGHRDDARARSSSWPTSSTRAGLAQGRVRRGRRVDRAGPPGRRLPADPARGRRRARPHGRRSRHAA